MGTFRITPVANKDCTAFRDGQGGVELRRPKTLFREIPHQVRIPIETEASLESRCRGPVGSANPESFAIRAIAQQRPACRFRGRTKTKCRSDSDLQGKLAAA